MKKYVSIFAMAAVAAAALVSCSKEIDKQDVIDNGVKMKTITVKTSIAETKTTLDANHENIVWSGGDKISIFNDVDNTNLETAYTEGADITIQVPEATNEIYAHYPYFNGNTNGPESVSVYISNQQTQENPGKLNGYYYPMVAKGTVSADNKALISLYPVASALALNLYHTSLSGEEYVKSVTVTPSSTNSGFIGRQTTNITVDDVQYTLGESSNPVKVTLTNSYALGNSKPSNKQTFAGQIYVCLAKQSYSDVKFEIETDKGIYTITSKNAAFDLENNDFVPVNINLEKASFVSFDTAVDPTAYSWTLVKNALTVGDKVVIAAAGSNNVAMSTTQNSNNRGKVDITKNGNAMTAFEGVQVFEVVAGSVTNPTTFAFKCLNGEQIGKYIAAASSSSNYLRSVSDIDDNASWSVSIDADNGVASVVAQGSFERNTLQYNSATNSTLFACYGSASQSAVVFYRVSLPSAELSFPKSSYSVNLGETFTKPTLTNPHDVSVSYASTNENVATVDESTGDITIKAEGSTTITASFAGNSTYSATEASYELTVVDPNKTYYVKVTEATTDWSGDYLIVYDNGTSSKVLTGVSSNIGQVADVTITNSRIVANDYASYNVVIAPGNTSGKYTMKMGSVYLAYNGSGNNLNTSSSVEKKSEWTLSIDDAENVNTTGRYLRYNTGSPRFCCYTSGQAKISFFKLKDNRPVVATPTFSVDAGEVNVGTNVTISCATEGATIYYTTDGSDPTSNSTAYSSALSISDNVTIKAIAVKEGSKNSGIASASYTVPVCATPSISIDDEGNVTITCDTDGAAIHYTTDDTTPTVSSATYTSSFTVSDGTTVKAIAIKSGSKDSAVAEETYSAGGGDPVTVTFTAGTDTSSELSLTKDGITITLTNGTLSRDDNYRPYASSTMTISSASGKTIKGIVFNCNANGTNKGGPGNLSTQTGSYSYESNGKIGTWSGSSTEIVFSVASQCQINSFSVTYE